MLLSQSFVGFHFKCVAPLERHLTGRSNAENSSKPQNSPDEPLKVLH